jgi:hypothetical protein
MSKPLTDKQRASLKPFKKGEERTKELGRKAGKASVIAKRKKRTFQDALQNLLYSELNIKQKKAFQTMGFNVDAEVPVTHMDLAGARCLAKIISTGDVNALEKLATMAKVHDNEQKIVISETSPRPVINLHLGERPPEFDKFHENKKESSDEV